MPRPPSNKALPPLFANGTPSTVASTAERGSNVPEVSVSELSNALKRTVEDRFGCVRLRGEISNYRGPHASGHAYFCLKDEGARIDAVVWKTSFARMRFKPEEGLEVVATGKITTFPGKSSYQIVIDSLEPAGIGALMAVLEERRRMLAARGLFDEARKQPLPFLPTVIGVVTSPTGAVIRDILHRVSARFPRHVVVWPVRVQGETSGAEVAAAIRGFNQLESDHAVRRPHVIIVARGGGSLEDLWGFNDEAVVLAVAEGRIPLISAVGHETDWTLIDHVADLRAPTPTGAAELALPVLADLVTAVDGLRTRQNNAALRRLDHAQTALRALLRLLPSRADLLAGPQQRLDRAALQMPTGAEAHLNRLRLTLARMARRLGAQSPQARMARAEQGLKGLGTRLQTAQSRTAERRRTRLRTLKARLDVGFAGRIRLLEAQNGHDRRRLAGLMARLTQARSVVPARGRARAAALTQVLGTLSYKAVLARGFAVLHGPDGRMLRGADEVQRTVRFQVEVADGRVEATPIAAYPSVGGDIPSVRRPLAGRRKALPPASPQGSLFES